VEEEDVGLLVLLDAPAPNPSCRRRPAQSWRESRDIVVLGERRNRGLDRTDCEKVQAITTLRSGGVVQRPRNPWRPGFRATLALTGASCASGKLEIKEVQGSHATLLREPYVAERAEALRRTT